MTPATAPPPAQAGQRLLWINGVTWVVLVVVLGYGVFTTPMPSPSMADRSAAGGGFMRAPGPATPVDTSPNPADQPLPEGTVSTGLRVIGMAGVPQKPGGPGKNPPGKAETPKQVDPAKTTAPEKPEAAPGKPDPAKNELRLGVFGAARAPKEDARPPKEDK